MSWVMFMPKYKYVKYEKELTRRTFGRQEREHVLVAARALGRPLQGSEQVHHVDGDATNNSPTNLVVCPDMAYHKLLHARQDAMNASGHAHYMKCPYCKEYDDPANMYARQNQYQAWHRKCAAARKRTQNPKTGPYVHMKGNKYAVE
jgi:hypothetical protein